MKIVGICKFLVETLIREKNWHINKLVKIWNSFIRSFLIAPLFDSISIYKFVKIQNSIFVKTCNEKLNYKLYQRKLPFCFGVCEDPELPDCTSNWIINIFEQFTTCFHKKRILNVHEFFNQSDCFDVKQTKNQQIKIC